MRRNRIAMRSKRLARQFRESVWIMSETGLDSVGKRVKPVRLPEENGKVFLSHCGDEHGPDAAGGAPCRFSNRPKA